MTLIDKAEALAILAAAPNAKNGLWAKRKKALYEQVAALPARGVGVPADVKDYAIDVSEAYDTMMEVQRNPAGAWQVIQALAGHIAALAPTDAAQEREAALKVPEVKALVEAARDRVHYWVNELDHCTCGACEALIAAVRAMEGRG